MIIKIYFKNSYIVFDNVKSYFVSGINFSFKEKNSDKTNYDCSYSINCNGVVKNFTFSYAEEEKNEESYLYLNKDICNIEELNLIDQIFFLPKDNQVIPTNVSLEYRVLLFISNSILYRIRINFGRIYIMNDSGKTVDQIII